MRCRLALIPACVLLLGVPAAADSTLPGVEAQARADARYWEAQGRADLAQQALNKLLLAHPRDLRVLFEIGQLDLRTNQVLDAKRMLQRMQALAPQAHETQQMALAYRFATTDRIQLASVERLLEMHRSEQAITQLKALFPDGAPDGDLGVRYYQILDADPANWAAARAGIAAIVARYPDTVRYQLALADLLVERPQTRAQGIDIAQRIAAIDATGRPQALAIWKRGLLRAAPTPGGRAAAREYLALNPQDTAVRQWLQRPVPPPSQRAATAAPEDRAARVEAQRLDALRATVKRLRAAGADTSALALLEGIRRQTSRRPPWLDSTESDVLATLARQALQAGRQDQALSYLERSQQLAPDDPWTRYHLAQLYVTLGVPEEARRLMQAGVDRAPSDDEVRFAQALLLASLDDVGRAQQALDAIPAGRRSAGMRALQSRLTVTGAEARAAALTATGDRRSAAQALEQGEAAADQPYQLAALARAWAKLGDPARGEQLLRQRVAADPTPSPELLLAWASAAANADDDVHLRAALHRLRGRSDLAAEQQQQVRELQDGLTLKAVARLRKAHDDATALTQLDAAIQTDPDSAPLRDARAEIYLAQSRYRQSLADEQWVLAHSDEAWRRGRAQSRIDSIDSRRDGFLAAGTSLREKSGDPGLSDFTDIELPAEARVALGYSGHLFAHVDSVHVSAGRLPDVYDQAALFGQVQARGPGSLTRFPGGAYQSATGAALALGYESDHWRFDLGSTPIGFPVTDVVGGLRYQGQLGGLALTADFARRPITSSELSYAGAVDPATGAVWGGVRQNGLTLRLAHYGGVFSATGSVQGSLLTGRNVPSNPYLGAHAGVDWRIFDAYVQRVYVGLTADYWHYGKNLSQYTFGHGGYYSPQQYQSLGVPIEWQGQVGRFTYVLRGSLSYSHSVVDAAPFYPGDAALQALAAASPLPSGYSAPQYGAGGGTGLGKSVSGGVEYALTPRWSLGANFDIDRSAYYAPNFFNVYLRRSFLGHDVERRDYPPQPPQPYSGY